MPARLVTTGYGRPAATALHREVAAAKRDDPLASVTVVVPANSVGVAARRALAAGDLGELTAAGRGVVGVSFLTVLRLAELVAAPRLAGTGRRPVSTPVVAAAVRAVLHRAPGLFGAVAEHAATEEALVAAHRELSDLAPDALDRLARQSPRAREVVRVHREATTLLAPEWYSEHDLMLAATDTVVVRPDVAAPFGRVVVYLPQWLPGPQARFVRVLADACDVTVVAGLTGDARADEPVVATVEALGCEVPDAERAAACTQPATRVVSISDADDEARAVVREVVDAMRAGVSLERMAVCYAAPEPYARLLHEHLDLAGIVHNGAGVRALHESAAGRALLRLLALAGSDFRRDDVLALIAGAPVRRADDSFERISRVAGIVRGLDQWRSRLDEYAARLAADEWDERERARVARLRTFVEELAHDVDPARGGSSWSARARWCHRLIARWLGDEQQRAAWPEPEQDAARRVEAALDRLAGLDAVEAAPPLDVFRRTVTLELEHAYDRVGRLGEGLLVGPVSYALGVELDRLFVCGLAEGTFPAVPRDDPLLSDAERRALEGDLRLRTARVDDDHRALLAALASTSGERILFFPRGDLRRSTERVLSRYARQSGAVDEIASFAHGIARADYPPTTHEYDVRATMAGIAIAAPEIDRSVDAVLARRSEHFTRFDGNLGSLGTRLQRISPAANGRVVSATGLERWVDCPYAYFVRHVLHVFPAERPEDIVQLRPVDRGSLVHEVLDRFVREGGRAEDRPRLHALLDTACDELEGRGLAGRRLFWQRDRRVLHDELDAWLDADEEERAARGLETLATELRFDDVVVELPDGRSLRFRGAADRVDRARDGRLVVVDYKTGRPDAYRVLSADDPVHGGAFLQLPLYAYAARAQFAPSADTGGDPAVEARYWFVGRGENERIGYEVDGGVDDEFRTALRAIVDGIEAGCFPARPDPPGPRFWISCEYCDPDGLGTADRWRAWERKISDGAMAPYRAVVAPDDEADGHGDG